MCFVLCPSPSCLKVNGLWVGDPQDFSVSPSPLGTNWVFELGWTGLGLGLEGLGTKGLVSGIDNNAGQGALLSYTEWNNNRIADYIIT